MLNKQVLQGHWNEIQGKLLDRWGELTDNELKQFDGNAAQLVGMIQRKTGEARGDVEDFLEEIVNNSNSTVEKASGAVRKGVHDVAGNVSDYAAHAGESARVAASRAADQVRDGYKQTEELVRRRPTESLAVCFGAGLITGVVLGLALRSR
ncbi:hypothetical protein CA54_33730 [Symmachiella macrocystis]|uniref:CsbD-like domain-containing protein n=1 Tax=Symmachiella macrocystis TaxID=2527985 RepID=A0A5C6BTJ8_9PLAN|nr:CsbD family protein [Symmachiella macrocystis]TWU14506.1 hypothetical protein CA54_33730 [Symmachiella macrocystis]